MKTIKALLVGCVFVATFLVLSVSGAVIDLTDNTFEHQTQASTGQTTGKWFVKFYAPWCGHCKTLAPVWEELDQRVQESNPQDGIIIAKVDATKQHELAKRFKIQSYPTLKYFANRKMYSYKGARNIDALYAFVTEGYKTAATDTIPIPPSAFEVKMKKIRKKFQDVADTNQNLKFLLEDFDHIIEFRKNAAVVLVVMGAIIGFMIGMIVCLLGGLRRAKKDAKTKKE